MPSWMYLPIVAAAGLAVGVAADRGPAVARRMVAAVRARIRPAAVTEPAAAAPVEPIPAVLALNAAAPARELPGGRDWRALDIDEWWQTTHRDAVDDVDPQPTVPVGRAMLPRTPYVPLPKVRELPAAPRVERFEPVEPAAILGEAFPGDSAAAAPPTCDVDGFTTTWSAGLTAEAFAAIEAHRGQQDRIIADYFAQQPGRAS